MTKRELNFMKQSKQSNSDSKNNQKNEKKNLNKERTENILKNLVIKSLSTTSSKNLKSFVNKEDGENLIGEFTNKNEEKQKETKAINFVYVQKWIADSTDFFSNCPWAKKV